MNIKTKEWIRKKKSTFSLIFPREYNFEVMLLEQAQKTLEGVDCFCKWLDKKPVDEPSVLEKKASDVDKMRYDMEEKLINAFSTPFDRQDIYTLSRNMDYILNYTKETAREMYAFGVEPDESIIAIAAALHRGTTSMTEGIKVMNCDKTTVEKKIREARRQLHEIDDIYISGMVRILSEKDTINALKKHEIFHHLKDAGWALRMTVDVLHKAVVGLN